MKAAFASDGRVLAVASDDYPLETAFPAALYDGVRVLPVPDQWDGTLPEETEPTVG